MEPIVKRLSDIIKREWIKYQWIDVTTLSDPNRMMLRGLERTPDEGAQALMEREMFAYAVRDRNLAVWEDALGDLHGTE